MNDRGDFLELTGTILSTARATSELLEITGLSTIDNVFGSVLEELNRFFHKIEENFRDFVIFERYVTCAHSRQQGYSLRNIPEEVKERVWQMRDDAEICGFTGEECKCRKSIEYLKERFHEKVSLLSSAGEFLKTSSKDLKEGIERIGDDVNALTESAKKIMEIADIIEIVALNAYIEAARLGEHGRGFKVIADEVRRASVRTNELASEIINSIKELHGKFARQIEKQTRFDEGIRDLEKDQSRFRDELNEDLLWMAQNFIDFLDYVRDSVGEDLKLLREVRETILSLLQDIDLTNQRATNTSKALVILARMIETFEAVMRREILMETAQHRIRELYEEFRRIPKLVEERQVVAKVENRIIDRNGEVVGEKVEEFETDVELF